MESQHVPVLEQEVVENLGAAKGGTFLDCTAGGGGHSAAILEAHPVNTVTAFDRDPAAVARARERLKGYGARASVGQASFSELAEVLSDRTFDGMLADLGVSTDQLKEGRGFSFQDQGPLDMRMDPRQKQTAADVVNGSSSQDLYVILRQGGVGPEARRIAQEIVAARPITSARMLAEVVQAALAKGPRRKAVHPATVVFQALRIAVNREFPELEALMKLAPALVRRPGGRLAVITFHSLEDQLVTSTMRSWQAGTRQHVSSRAQAAPERLGRVVHKRALQPGEAEVAANPSARSARLRVFEFY